jgi:hypothetical protein
MSAPRLLTDGFVAPCIPSLAAKVARPSLRPFDVPGRYCSDHGLALRSPVLSSARRMLAQALIAEARCLRRPGEGFQVAGRPRPRRCVTATDRSAQSRPRSGAPRCATGVTWRRIRKSASPRRSCQSGRGRFKKGDPKPPNSGCKPGVRNRLTADIKSRSQD